MNEEPEDDEQEIIQGNFINKEEDHEEDEDEELTEALKLKNTQ